MTGDPQPVKPTTTEEEDKHTLGQRRVNLIWEVTQAVIAQGVVGSVLYVAAQLAMVGINPIAIPAQLAIATTAFVLLSNLASLVIGFYFGRTNHQRVGGVDLGR